MSSTAAPEPLPGDLPGELLLEYVTLPFCRDCLRFEELLGDVRVDYPELQVRAVPADSVRGRQLSVEQGIMRFPVIALGGEVIAIESVAAEDLRWHLDRAREA